MLDALKQAAHYRYLETEFRHLAAIEAPTDIRNYYLQMAKHYSALAETKEQASLATFRRKMHVFG
jgi:hypothetical protein